MKKLFAVSVVLLYSSVLYAQGNVKIIQETNKNLFPTKYSTILYADQVTDNLGDNNLLAAHFRNKGGGLFEWQRDIKKGGNYEVGICYATQQPGTTVMLYTKEDTISAILQATTGYFQKKKKSQPNFERKQMPEIIHLNKGKNKISLQLITRGPKHETLLHSVELLPVSKKWLIQKEWQQAEKIQAKPSWFTNAPYGVMFHWTSQTAPEHGPLKSYNEAVNDFNVGAFVQMVRKIGAWYIIFTTNHAENYFPGPLKDWEKIYPGHTAHRDLIEVIADSLGKYNIKLLLYLNSFVYGRSDKVDDNEFRHLNYSLIKAIGEHYKKKVAGYWFDSWYQAYEGHPDFNFKRFYKISKRGNPNRLVCFNSWLYPIVTLWQDYWAGEVYFIGNPPESRVLRKSSGRGLQAHSLIVMEQEGWLHSALNTPIPPPSIKAENLINFISKSKGNGPVTINIQIYQDGKIDHGALDIMEEVKNHFNKEL